MSDRESISITRGTVERGTRFIVTRGRVEVASDGGFSLLSRPIVTHSKEHDGFVFEALEIVGPVIVARRIATSETWRKDLVGRVTTINLGEVEVMPATDEFFNLMPHKLGATV